MMDLCVVVLCLVVSGLLGDGAWSAMEVEPSALLLLFSLVTTRPAVSVLRFSAVSRCDTAMWPSVALLCSQ